jgi:hypothetical protein
LPNILYWLTIDRQNDIARRQARTFRRTLGQDVFNENTVFSIQAKTQSQSRGNISGKDADSVMVNVSLTSHLLINAKHYIAGNRQADSLVTTRLSKNQRSRRRI